MNPLKTHPERITKADKKMINDLDYKGIKFLCLRIILATLKKKNNILMNVICYENKLTYPVYLSNQEFENWMNLLMISDEGKSHYVYIKDFNRFMCNKTKCKNKKHFCRYCLQCFSSEKVLTEHKEVCLEINGKQIVKLRSGLIKLKYYFKQLAVPFKIYADFECNVKRVKCSNRSENTSYTEKY